MREFSHWVVCERKSRSLIRNSVTSEARVSANYSSEVVGCGGLFPLYPVQYKFIANFFCGGNINSHRAF